MHRRALLAGGIALPLAARATVPLSPLPDDEAAWAAIAADYDRPTGVIQLENGNWGAMARPVAAVYVEQVARVNRDTSYYARRGMAADLAAARAVVAEAIGAPLGEVALTRNATEALKAILTGFQGLSAGDTVLCADLDYGSVKACLASVARRAGARTIQIALPEPATYDGLIDTYRTAFDREPRLRLVLLTHVSHRTGLVLPVREIAALARARGIAVVVDAAHSSGQLDFAVRDLGADFVGLNLHKWWGAPLGVGALHIRTDALDCIAPDPASEGHADDPVLARVHTGTVDFAAQLTLPAAIAWHRRVAPAARIARLRALRDRWVRALADRPTVRITTPADPRLYGAITAFRLAGRTTAADNRALARRLLDEFGIFTVHRDGPAAGDCVRVTPSLATLPADVDRLARAIRAIAGSEGV